ncbi:MAG: hypothetical protein QOE90_3581 [Thermoplasmata archaeon]|jgi:uncharacterized protein YbjT (DUF2867 family)|nr:hypothetical protein [Thermoplasmata archaeon]
MRLVLFGATGMVGRGALLEALDDPAVTRVLAVGRRPVDLQHPKLEQATHEDFTDFGPLAPRLAGYDGCLFCLGVSAVGMSEADYTRVTHDFTLAAARAFLAANPGSAFVYVSGQGTGSSRQMWSRVKGRTEEELLAMPFGAAYMFRPGFIRPERGVRSSTRAYRIAYAVLRPFGGLLQRMAPGSATTTTRVGRAMLQCVEKRPALRLVETRDINRLAAERGT